MIKKLLPIWILFFVLLSSVSVFAHSKGSVKICLPEGMENEEISYQREGEEKKKVKVEQDGIATIKNLSEGTYEITIPETENYEFQNMKIQLPMWDEEEHKMKYDITAYPKYNIKENTPETGDSNKLVPYVGFAIISFIFVCIMSCHNHFKCGRMSHEYSRIWRK